MSHQIHSSRIASYIDLIFDTFLELQGDRKSGDDENVVGGLARLNGYKVVVVGYQKDEVADTSGILRPEGYRKCSRLIRLAEDFGKPVILFVDVLGMDSSPSLEQQQINEASARNLEEMSSVMTPVISIVMGGSCGITAIDMCAADRVLMLEDASRSVGTSTDVAGNDSLYLKTQDLLDLNIVHRIVSKSLEDKSESVANSMRTAILEEFRRLTQIDPEVLVQQRLHRLQYQFLTPGTSRPPSGTQTGSSED
jgi:acetyl-CoA carboxylase carboxyl transferase subunit alpha